LLHVRCFPFRFASATQGERAMNLWRMRVSASGDFFADTKFISTRLGKQRVMAMAI
jgi:hypothetical protein